MATPTTAPKAVPAKIVNGKKTFTVLENNPQILTSLAHKLGLSPTLEFTDIFSLTEPSLLSLISRPVLGLIAIIPLTPAWKKDREKENSRLADKVSATTQAKGTETITETETETDNENKNHKNGEEDITFFKQTISNACGSYALIHTLLNGPSKSYILPNSTLSKILTLSNSNELKNASIQERAKILYENEELEVAHQEAAQLGDSEAPEVDEQGRHVGLHFVAFVKVGGRLVELEGSRNQPLDRGPLAEEEDVLSENGIRQGIGRVIELERENGGGDLRFSVIALVEKVDGEGKG